MREYRDAEGVINMARSSGERHHKASSVGKGPWKIPVAYRLIVEVEERKHCGQKD